MKILITLYFEILLNNFLCNSFKKWIFLEYISLCRNLSTANIAKHSPGQMQPKFSKYYVDYMKHRLKSNKYIDILPPESKSAIPGKLYLRNSNMN